MIGPRLARFYGWTDDYIRSLNYKKINDYLVGIDVLITEEMERKIDIIMLPYVADEMKQKILDHYCRKIELEKPKEEVSLKLMAAAYGMSA